MALGIELRTADNTVFFSTDTQTWNYIGSFVTYTDSTLVATYSTLSLMNDVIIQISAIDNPPDNQAGYIPTVYVSGNDVYAEPGAIRALVVVLGR